MLRLVGFPRWRVLKLRDLQVRIQDAIRTMTMGAAPSHGTTMGYVSDPFRTEEQGDSDTRRGFARHAYAVPLAGFSK